MAAKSRDHGVLEFVPDFVQMNNLACESIGGKVLFATDDWFAAAENLLKKSEPEFKVGLFTEYGKWMDGWETRRKRIPGHDWSIIELGVPGIIYGFHVNTRFFTGNYAPQISVQAACLQPEKSTLLSRGDKIGSAASEEDYQVAEKDLLKHFVEPNLLLQEAQNGGLNMRSLLSELHGYHTKAYEVRKVSSSISSASLCNSLVVQYVHAQPWDSIEFVIPSLELYTNFLNWLAWVMDEDDHRGFKSENWDYLLKMTALKPGYDESCHNYFHVSSRKRWTHIRLNIYPDGGIARFKVYGIGQRDWSLCGPNELEDLLSMVNGGVCLGFSDAHYGHPRNLIGTGKAADMGDGWETARRLDRPPILKVDDKGILQLPGNEWTVFRLGHPGLITHIEIDTNHFKGNSPNSCKIEASVLTPKEEEEKSKAKWDEKFDRIWTTLLPVTQLQPHKNHFIDGTLISLQEVVTHVRITIAPDGGVSRVRLWGFPRQLL